MKESKTKTFQKDSDPSDIMAFVMDNIDCNEREVITDTPPSYDIISETNFKYTVTITKVLTPKD
jgi:hypothetical protein